MSDPSTQIAIGQIVKALAARYQSAGYHRVDTPAVTLLSVTDQAGLESALAELIDRGEVVPVGRGGVALAPGVRLALLSRTVLEAWVDKVSRESGHTFAMYRDAIAAELAVLTGWAAATPVPDELALRAAELAGVLATRDLDPQAMDIVARHGGSPHRRLAALVAAAPGSVPTASRLVEHLRNVVSTDDSRR